MAEEKEDIEPFKLGVGDIILLIIIFGLILIPMLNIGYTYYKLSK